MPACPACGSAADESAEQCPGCHLSVSLFGAVREAAGPASSQDPAYVRTIGELLATVDLESTKPPASDSSQGLLSRPRRTTKVAASTPTKKREAKAIAPLRELPQLPKGTTDPQLRRRIDEYFELGRRLGADFTDFQARYKAASLAADHASLELVARDMFVHILSRLAEEFEETLAQRNELTQLVPTPSADVELDAARESARLGDLAGALRRLAHVRDELLRVEEEWEVGRILITECDLLAQSIRELGGDPSPAQGPLEEGRKLVTQGRRSEAEKLLARAAVALWTVLEPFFFAELKRVRDRLNEARSSGSDIGPAVSDLRVIATELRQRNFVGVVLSFRGLRDFAEKITPLGPEGVGPALVAASVRSDPSA